ncbi:MAG: gluconolaconase [Rhodospirillaceae bacterium]|nr:gluconolaconase [Rhodospirillaceae bacterium]
MQFREIASGLRFPEGPIAMPDGSVILVEIERRTLSRVSPDGRVSVIAETGGGPNGAAMGPDGKCYICNNGGFDFVEERGMLRPHLQASDYSGGRIERVDIETGAVEVLYTECGGNPLKGPNDLVFDSQGGFYFTDLGKVRPREQDRGAVYYAKADGSAITEVVFPAVTPNGVGLSPDEKTLYVAETEPGRLWAWPIKRPGELEKELWPSVNGGRLVTGVPGYKRFDSLAVDSAGNICVGTLMEGGITVVAPDGSKVEHIPTDDPYATNICFGGPDLRTAFITLSTGGRLVAAEWPRPGLPLNYLNM